jgi:hypothetical protein
MTFLDWEESEAVHSNLYTRTVTKTIRAALYIQRARIVLDD